MFVSLAKTFQKVKKRFARKLLYAFLSIDHMKPIIIEPKEKKNLKIHNRKLIGFIRIDGLQRLFDLNFFMGWGL